MKLSGTNGKSKIIYYLLGIVQLFAISFGGYWIGRIEKIESRVDEHEKVASAQWLQFESRVAHDETRYEEIIRRLDRIENKLDR